VVAGEIDSRYRRYAQFGPIKDSQAAGAPVDQIADVDKCCRPLFVCPMARLDEREHRLEEIEFTIDVANRKPPTIVGKQSSCR